MNKTLNLLTLTLVVIGFQSSLALAEPPKLQTPAPVIYLSDNLDEKDELGWCVDTLGRGFSEKLQAHSCKPKGGDVQFSYDEEKAQIASATYENKCAMLLDEAKAGVKLGLVDCDTELVSQQFVYDAEAGSIHPKSDDSLCLAVGAASKSAGPFMSRDLALAACEGTDKVLLTWTVLAE